MGVDARLSLPPQVRLEDVADLAGILSGLPFVQDPYLRVQGVSYETSTPCASYFPTTFLRLAARDGETLVDGEAGHFCYYHGVSRGTDDDHGAPLGWHKFSLKSTAYWIALATRLADFFGGVVDYNDCDDSDVDYRKPARPAASNDGEGYFAYKDRMVAQAPLTMAELRDADERASYKMDDDKYERAREHALATQ